VKKNQAVSGKEAAFLARCNNKKTGDTDGGLKFCMQYSSYVISKKIMFYRQPHTVKACRIKKPGNGPGSASVIFCL